MAFRNRAEFVGIVALQHTLGLGCEWFGHAELRSSNGLGIEPMNAREVLVLNSRRDPSRFELRPRDVRGGWMPERSHADFSGHFGVGHVRWGCTRREWLGARGTRRYGFEVLAAKAVLDQIGACVVGAMPHVLLPNDLKLSGQTRCLAR